jgi:hypothetical protein
MRVIVIIFSIFFLWGCYTQKKAERSLNKAQINYPELVAEKSSLWYPCIQFKGTSDSSQYKSFVKQIDSLNGLYFVKIDSIYFYDTLTKFDTIVKLKKCQDLVTKYRTIYKNLPAIHDTIIMVSTAEKYTIKYLENEREESHKRYDRSMKLNIWLLIALIVSLLVHLFKKK